MPASRVQPVDWVPHPEVSMCYQDDVVALFEQQGRGTGVNRLADLLRAKKATGRLGAVAPGSGPHRRRAASEREPRLRRGVRLQRRTRTAEPSYECACLNAAWNLDDPRMTAATAPAGASSRPRTPRAAA